MFVAPTPLCPTSHCAPIIGQLRFSRRTPNVIGCVQRVLDVRGQVVLQVLAHAGQVRDDRDVQRGQLVRVPDAGQLQQLRRVDRATGEYHLTRRDEPFGRPGSAGRACGR